MNMLLAIGRWFVTSKYGLTILLCIAVAGGAIASWKLFAHHYYVAGRADCQADIIAQQAKANQEQARENEKRNAASSEVAKKADAAGATVAKDIDTKTNSTKEVIRYVYRDPPAGHACVRPVDKRVQDEFNKAVRRANG